MTMISVSLCSAKTVRNMHKWSRCSGTGVLRLSVSTVRNGWPISVERWGKRCVHLHVLISTPKKNGDRWTVDQVWINQYYCLCENSRTERQMWLWNTQPTRLGIVCLSAWLATPDPNSSPNSKSIWRTAWKCENQRDRCIWRGGRWVCLWVWRWGRDGHWWYLICVAIAMPGLSILVSYYYDTFQVNHVLICATHFVRRSNHLRILARVCMSGMTPLSHARYSIISVASHLTANLSIDWSTSIRSPSLLRFSFDLSRWSLSTNNLTILRFFCLMATLTAIPSLHAGDAPSWSSRRMSGMWWAYTALVRA